MAIPQNVCFAAEVGLVEEIRALNRIEQRIIEAEKLGFDKVILSKFNKITKKNYHPATPAGGIQIIKNSKIEDVVSVLF